MDVVVIFRFPTITDPSSEAADQAIESLTIDLKNSNVDCDWHIDEAIGDVPVKTTDEPVTQSTHESCLIGYKRLHAACVEAMDWAHAQDEDNLPDWVDRMAMVMENQTDLTSQVGKPSRNPDQLFLTNERPGRHAITRRGIAEDLNDYLECLGGNNNEFAPDDDRLTDEICAKYAEDICDISDDDDEDPRFDRTRDGDAKTATVCYELLKSIGINPDELPANSSDFD